MTIAQQCFKILTESQTPLTSRELAKLVGHRQTRNSVEAALYKYQCEGYLYKTLSNKPGKKRISVWVVVDNPFTKKKEIKKPRSLSLIHTCFNVLNSHPNPLSAMDLERYTGERGLSARISSILKDYTDSGYIRKVPYKWSTYGKIGYVLVKMPEKFR